MEQVQTENLPAALIDQKQFGEMIHIPNALNQNVSLTMRAKESVNATLSVVEAINLQEVDATVMETHDAKLNELSGKISAAVKIMTERRMPYTKFFDEVKSKFTAQENELTQLGEKVRSLRTKWAQEKNSRAIKVRANQEAESKKAAEFVELKAEVAKEQFAIVTELIAVKLKRMAEAFYSKSAEDLPVYCEQLKAYEPKLDTTIFRTGVTSKLGNDMVKIFSDVITELVPQAIKSYADSLNAERDRLVEMMDSRIREIKEGDAKAAEARIKAENEERERKAKEQQEDFNQQAEMNKEVNSINAQFDVAAKAEPLIQQTKGSTSKKKYKATTHKAHVAIIQYWVKNCMNAMTIDELDKKLSFMRTDANKALNAGTVLEAEGLEVVDDVVIRRTK